MAKNDSIAKTVETVEMVEAPKEVQALTLTEFCTRLSAKDRRVELIGAFEHSERVAGRVTDAADNYAARYQEFINQPA